MYKGYNKKENFIINYLPNLVIFAVFYIIFIVLGIILSSSIGVLFNIYL